MVYSLKTGIWKSIKNVAITIGIPAAVLLVDTWPDWIPNEYNAIALPIMGLVSYFVKNYIQNK